MLTASLSRSELHVEMVTSGSLEDDLEWADVCASPWSTSLLEAMIAGRACFWTNARNDRMVRTGDYIDEGVGILVTQASEWATIISTILHNPVNAERYILPRKRLEEVGLITPDDGKDWFQRFARTDEEFR